VASAASFKEARISGANKVACNDISQSGHAREAREAAFIETHKIYELESPNYPGEYPNRQKCAFQFWSDGRTDYEATFWCDAFDVKASPDCRKDRIEFWEDSWEFDSICNNNFNSSSWLRFNVSSYFAVDFKSNKRGTAGGFKCYVSFWYSKCGFEGPCDYDNDYTDYQTSPSYNNDYDWSQWNDTANDWNSNYTGPTGGYYDGPSNGGYYDGIGHGKGSYYDDPYYNNGGYYDGPNYNNDWSQWNDTANDWNSNYTGPTGGIDYGNGGYYDGPSNGGYYDGPSNTGPSNDYPSYWGQP